MDKYRLIIKWADGEIEEHVYDTQEEADSIGNGYCKAFGKQIEWAGTRKEVV